ncbi:MAG: hypothetical protein HZB61_06700 [Nitrospirae bacterium]|nr:hypothetical protein [Nitrospirota bacterium]
MVIDSNPKRRFLYFLSLSIIGVYIYLQVSHFLKVPEPQQYPDSLEYMEAASSSIFSVQFWGGLKPPLVPLVYKIFHSNVEAITFIQLIFSIFSWIFLAYVVAKTLNNTLLLPLAYILILGFSVSSGISMWNRAILSESFSLSILACFIGIWILFIQKITLTRVIMLMAISTMFAFVRSANGFMLLMICGILALVIFLNRRLNQRHYFIIISITFFILFLASNAISNTNNRWTIYFLNVVSKRILPDQELRTYFENHGMPVNESLMARAGRWSHEDDFAYYKDPKLEQFRNWLYSHGKSTYSLYLLTHPAYLIFEPLKDFQSMMYGSRIIYYAPKGAPVSESLFGYLSSWKLFPVYIFLLGIFFGLNLFFVFSRKLTIPWVPIILILLVYPLAVIVWHADAMEIDRHVLPAAVQARVGFILLILFAFDATLLECCSMCEIRHEKK